MKAAVLTKFGPSDVFQIQEMERPTPKFGEVLVKVIATSVNPLDCQVRRGDYSDEVSLPTITGHDISGEIVALGEGVKNFKVGDEVYYVPQIFGKQGSYAEYHVADETIVAPKPKNVSHLEAASLPLVAGTAWEMLVMRTQLRLNESILIHGGAGGVGSVTIQLAKVMGANVITTAKSSQRDFLMDLGADYVIDYQSEDYIEVIDEITKGKGVDVVTDTIGGTTLSDSPKVLTPMGRVVTIVDISQPQNLLYAWGKNATYHFVFTRQNRGKLNELTKLIEKKKIRPTIGKTFRLEDISEAHALLENRSESSFSGKVAIEIG